MKKIILDIKIQIILKTTKILNNPFIKLWITLLYIIMYSLIFCPNPLCYCVNNEFNYHDYNSYFENGVLIHKDERLLWQQMNEPTPNNYDIIIQHSDNSLTVYPALDKNSPIYPIREKIILSPFINDNTMTLTNLPNQSATLENGTIENNNLAVNPCSKIIYNSDKTFLEQLKYFSNIESASHINAHLLSQIIDLAILNCDNNGCINKLQLKEIVTNVMLHDITKPLWDSISNDPDSLNNIMREVNFTVMNEQINSSNISVILQHINTHLIIISSVENYIIGLQSSHFYNNIFASINNH